MSTVLEQVEDDIKAIYVFWAEEAPGVTPKEEGVLADLWARFDELVEQEDEQ